MEAYKHIHAIVLSPVKSTFELEKYRLMGEVDYIIKPFTYEEYVHIAADIKNKAGL
jgi:response regulator of citrate/malate metabolism